MFESENQNYFVLFVLSFHIMNSKILTFTKLLSLFTNLMFYLIAKQKNV